MFQRNPPRLIPNPASIVDYNLSCSVESFKKLTANSQPDGKTPPICNILFIVPLGIIFWQIIISNIMFEFGFCRTISQNGREQITR